MQAKLEISLYTYQKKYFEKIITPALLKNSEIFIQNNIYDEETLNRFRRLIIREQELVIHKQMNRKKDAEWMIPEAKKIIQKTGLQ